MINISVALLLPICSSNCQGCSSGGCLSEMQAIIILVKTCTKMRHELSGRCLICRWGHERQPSAMRNHGSGIHPGVVTY